ncbi:MAG: DUF3606 domain-containing protein [Parvibaculaceae bacterium]
MADNKKARGKADRSKVAKGEAYEVAYFSKKQGISAEDTRGLIDQVGNSRKKLTAAAEVLKSKRSKKTKKTAKKASKKAARKTAKKKAGKRSKG